MRHISSFVSANKVVARNIAVDRTVAARKTPVRLYAALYFAVCAAALLVSVAANATLVSAVLPTSRSAEVNKPVTVFATMLNAGAIQANNCRPALASPVDVTLTYQTTNPATNAPTGTPNTAVSVAANSGQSWLLSLNANAEFAPSDLAVDFLCDNVDPPQTVEGVNTILISASNTPTADIIALSATATANGVLEAGIDQAAAFSVASINVGADANITAAPQLSSGALLSNGELQNLTICQTNPTNGNCLATPESSVSLTINNGDTPTFSVFLQNNAAIEFLPASNRVSVTFTEESVRRGSTSVALSVVDRGPEGTGEPEGPGATTESRPNVLLIISDDQGLDASAQYSRSDDLPNTPNLDQLANAGLTFDNAWATPSCTTTRATMLTGQFGVNSGIDRTPGRIEPGTLILQQLIRDNTDYATAVFGKWHVGGPDTEDNHPNLLGVGDYAGNVQGNIDDYFDWKLTVNGVSEQTTDYHTSRITDLASDWIAQQSDPWFAWVAYSAPHSPFHLPPDDLQSTGLPGGEAEIANDRRAYYLAAIEAMDTEIGELLSRMPAEERANTLVIYIGDNGTPRAVVDNSVFINSHAKNSLYQGGVAVPLFASGAGVSRQGEREAALVTSTDLYSTIAEITGAGATAPADSVSFAATLASQDSGARNFAYSEIQGVDGSGYTVRDATYKLIVFSDGTEELYNVASDPDEGTNLLPGDATLQQIASDLRAFGLMTRGEPEGSSSDAIDITDAILTSSNANCADFVASYRADALDAARDILFQGDLVISVVDQKCVFSTNVIPNHTFNDGTRAFPNEASAQAIAYSMTTAPQIAAQTSPLLLTADNAVMLNGVKVDLLAAGCFGVGDGRVGCNDINQPWRFDPLAPDSAFNVDTHNAHTQPDGSYHYHGSPNALFSNTPDVASPVIGFASDGFPIFGSFINDGDGVREVQSSYRLRTGNRPDGAGDPGGAYDGTFRDDYEFVEGSGDLDECNGSSLSGTYGYYVTNRFPYILGCFSGTPDSSFIK